MVKNMHEMKKNSIRTPATSATTSRRSIPGRTRKQVQPSKPEDDGPRNELIAKSARLFREKGYEKTTVRDIAAAVGMQAGSWFYHFKSKQEILVAVMEQGMTRSLRDIEAISVQSLPPREAFRQLVLAHLKTLLAPNHDFIPVLLYEGRSLDKVERVKIVALTNRYEAIWNEVIDALHRSGDWAMPTKLDRLFVFGTLNWTTQWFRGGAGMTIEQLADQTVSFLLRTVPKERGR
jgi:AcrR family transcriptional regulator